MAVNPESKPVADRSVRARAALRAAQVAFWDLELASREIFVEPTGLEALGLEPRDHPLPLAQFEQLSHPDDLAALSLATKALIKGETKRLHCQHRLAHADGRWVWMETIGLVTERDARGRVTRLSGTQTNITERKQLERALSNTLRVMRTLLETLPLPVIMRDTERRVTLVNAAWEKMLGMSREEIVGKLIEQYPRKVLSDNHRETDLQVLREGVSLRYETIVHGIDGTDYDVIVAKTPLVADDGTITGLAAIVTDISEQKRISAALEKARVSAEAAMHAKSRFLANMSHELRTPLNGVVGMASLLENTALDAKQRRFVRTLRGSAEALVTLINDVLDLSKAEAGKLELANGPFELRRELEHVIGLFGARACAKGIDIAAHVAHDVPAVLQGDAIRLRQVLGNLVNNAVKFTESGAVLVSVARSATDARTLEFSVTDTGIGVAADEQARIFEAFEQADGSVTRKFGGTGLGLAISRQLVELMQGSLGVQSATGHGSRFWFRIPCAESGAELHDIRPAMSRAALVVGLPLVMQGAIRETLGRECAQVICVEALPAAVEALAALSSSIQRVRIVLDVNATARLEQSVITLRGVAAARRGEGLQLEVIALLPPDADARTPPGVDRCLVKPLYIPALLAASDDSGQSTSNTTRQRVLPQRGSRGRALVVEDNAVNQEMARAMLDMLGFDVLTASNGREGVQAATAHAPIDLIFMDCQMPVMDGLAAARAIRETEPDGQHVPIVALTGNAMPGDREACVAAGMDDYLAKPFSLSALRAMVEKWAPAPP